MVAYKLQRWPWFLNELKNRPRLPYGLSVIFLSVALMGFQVPYVTYILYKKLYYQLQGL